MRRRLVSAVVLVTTLALALFGIPLALAADRLAHSTAESRLVQDAATTAAALPSFPLSAGDPVDLAPPDDGASMAVYDPAGRLVTGSGPATADGAVRAALNGRVSTAGSGGALVAAVPLGSQEQVVGAVRAEVGDAVVAAVVHRQWLLMDGLAVGVLLAATLVSVLIGRRLARPLEQLAGYAEQRGDAAPPARSGVREVDDVTAALVASTRRVGDALGRERQLSTAMAHQLRTPLTGLRVRLEAGAVLTPEGSAALLADVTRLQATVDDVLQAMREPSQRDPIQVGDLVRAGVEHWRRDLGRHHRRLELDVAPHLPPVRAAPAALRQVLDVLLDNAARHGAGAVRVAARPVGGGVVIEVSDEGTGFGTSAAAGHGLGLDLARRLVEADGGRLVTPTTPGASTVHIVYSGEQP